MCECKYVSEVVCARARVCVCVCVCVRKCEELTHLHKQTVHEHLFYEGGTLVHCSV